MRGQLVSRNDYERQARNGNQHARKHLGRRVDDDDHNHCSWRGARRGLSRRVDGQRHSGATALSEWKWGGWLLRCNGEQERGAGVRFTAGTPFKDEAEVDDRTASTVRMP